MGLRQAWIGLGVALALCGAGCADEGGGGGGALPAEAGTAVAAYEGDLAFVDGLVPLGLVAVWMAEDAIAKANRPELKAFATKLKAARTKEIAQMRHHRQAWVGEDESPPIEYEPLATVPGGRGFDARWAKEMIRHEQAAIDIAERALEEAETPEARALAKQAAEKHRKDQAQLRTWEATWRGD